MEYVKPKVHDETNYYQGIDLNNKDEVRKEFNRRRAVHSFFTLIFIAMLGVLGVFLFDFWRVNFREGHPLFAIKTTVENGKLYKGIGYQVLYCDDGSRYSAAVVYQDCLGEEEEVDSYIKVLHQELIRLGTDKDFINVKNLESLTINSYTFDEVNPTGGSDYLLDLTIVCKDNKSCFTTKKKFYDKSNIKVILRMDSTNSAYDMIYFKNSGAYNQLMADTYKEKIKQFLVDQGNINLDDLRDFNVRFEENYGVLKYKGVEYADSYLINISFMCYSSGNDCVKQLENKDKEGDYSNMSFTASLFLDAEGEVALIGYREYLGLSD